MAGGRDTGRDGTPHYPAHRRSSLVDHPIPFSVIRAARGASNVGGTDEC